MVRDISIGKRYVLEKLCEESWWLSTVFPSQSEDDWI